MTNSRPAFRKDDTGIHAACCNTNTWKAVQGSGTVFINSKEAVRLGDQTKHCGGSGNMIEGSDNVMIGGASSGGGGGGGGGGSSSAQAGGGTDSGSGSQSGTNSNQTGRSAGGGGGAGAQAGGGGGGGGGAGSSESAASEKPPTSANPTKDPEKDSFAIWLDLVAVNGGKLIGEIVHIIDPDTKEVIATKEVGEDGNVFVEVPKNKAYHVDIEPKHYEEFHPEPGDESAILNQVTATFYDEDGLPLEAGVEVKVKGDDVNLTAETGIGGHVDVPVAKGGTFELTIRGQTFVVDSLTGAELKHSDAKPYEFQVMETKK